MNRRPFISAGLILDERTPEQIAERRRAIQAEMARVAKASERNLPDAERRQILDVQHTVSAIAAGETIERTAGPTWNQRLHIAAVLAVGLPAAAIAGYVVARFLGLVADAAGAALSH